VVDAMEKDFAYRPRNLRVDGGMVANELLMQFQRIFEPRSGAPRGSRNDGARAQPMPRPLAVKFFSGLEEFAGQLAVDPHLEAASRRNGARATVQTVEERVTRSFD